MVTVKIKNRVIKLNCKKYGGGIQNNGEGEKLESDY